MWGRVWRVKGDEGDGKGDEGLKGDDGDEGL